MILIKSYAFFCNVLGNSVIKNVLIKYTCVLMLKTKLIRTRIQKLSKLIAISNHMEFGKSFCI